MHSWHNRTECYALFLPDGTGKPGLGQGFKVRERRKLNVLKMGKVHVVMSGRCYSMSRPWERRLLILPKLVFPIIIEAWQPTVNPACRTAGRREPDNLLSNFLHGVVD